MAFDPEFLELMPLTCTVRPPATTNLHGESSYGAAVTPHCHVQYTGVVVSSVGEQARYEEGIVYLDGSYDMTTAWDLAIPTPGGTRQVKIQSVEQNTDETGWHHTALHFGAF